MIHPKTLLAEWVTALQSLPNLVKALGGDDAQIQFYTENATVFGQPTQNNIRLAILSMPPGSVMIACMTFLCTCARRKMPTSATRIYSIGS
jgi:hypothetical protein